MVNHSVLHSWYFCYSLIILNSHLCIGHAVPLQKITGFFPLKIHWNFIEFPVFIKKPLDFHWFSWTFHLTIFFPTIDITVFWKLPFQWYINSIERTVFLITGISTQLISSEIPLIFRTSFIQNNGMSLYEYLFNSFSYRIWALYMAWLIQLNIYILYISV